MTLRPYQKEAHDAVVSWIKKNRTPCLVEAATGCHAAGHPILMHDGSIKPVEDVQIGDLVMGPDSNPRRVVRLHRGTDEMFTVAPNKGESFTVNAGHIFSMYVTPSRNGRPAGYREASTTDILSFGVTDRHRVKLQRCAVDLPTSDQIVPPWVVGVLLGDGCLTRGVPSLCSPDEEVVSGVLEWARSLGCGMSKWERNGCGQYNIVDPMANRGTENRCRIALKAIGIYGSGAAEKRVPTAYRIADRSQRLEVIAGLLDTDGCLSRAGYDWISKSEGLANDMVFLCRSVGLAAYVRECTKGYGDTFRAQYWRVSISGDCTIIPCRVARRKAPDRMQKKRVDVVGFSIQPAGLGEYFGFELDGDHLYLDGHFVRHHNSGKSHIIASVAETIHNISKGKHVLVLQPSAELVEQNAEKYRATGSKCSLFSASAGEKSLRYPVVFGTPLTVKNRISRFGNQFSAVVIDECFTGETLVETIRGNVPIGSLRNGDMVCNAMGSGEVMGIFTKSVSELYEVRTTDGRTIRCTGNHPFFTDNGWVSAEKLVNGQIVFCKEDVSSLHAGIWTKKVQPQGESEYLPMLGGALGKADHLLSILREEVEKPDALGSFSRKNVEIPKRYWASPDCKDGKWNWEHKASGCHSDAFGVWLDCGALDQDECRTQERGVPELLQGGHCEPDDDDCHRGGRREPLHSGEEGSRQEKGRVFGSIRVESVSRVELDGPEVVYNLHVSGHPSYYAGGILVHNCHGITPTVLSIIEAMREANPNLRVVGLSATPYRMNTGYIFGMWPDGKPVPEGETKEPYFGACVYRIRARSLIEQGYLTPPVIGGIGVASYETLNMQVNSRGQFEASDIDRAFHGHGRKTAEIIADVIGQSRGREGVMIFAATVRHAEECMASLPPELSALVTGETPKADRKRILKDFKARKIKYLVNVSVLTTGFDAPHVDVVAILRATESVGLLQQIVGRGLRLSPGKANCLVLDYAQNIDRHCPDGDIFTPEIKVRGGEKGEAKLTCECPDCGIENEFSARPNEEDYSIDRYGYFLDLDGLQIETEWGAMPAHFGRRCQGKMTIAGDLVQCGYRWTSKPCPSCDAPNDIAARYCTTCKAEIVDPNEKLRLDFKQLKKDPTKIQCDEVLDWRILPSISRSGKEVDRVDVVTPYRSFSYWVLKYPTFSRAMKERSLLDSLGGQAPMTITYQKDAETGFYRAIAYNRPKDEAPK